MLQLESVLSKTQACADYFKNITELGDGDGYGDVLRISCAAGIVLCDLQFKVIQALNAVHFLPLEIFVAVVGLCFHRIDRPSPYPSHSSLRTKFAGKPSC